MEFSIVTPNLIDKGEGMDKKRLFSPLTADATVLPNSIQINAKSIKEYLKVREIVLKASREKEKGRGVGGPGK